MRRCRLHLALATAAVSATVACDAAEALSAVELRDYCVAYESDLSGTEGMSCYAYVRGFLAGASAIDFRVRPRPQIHDETWSDRALRTRLGGVRGKPPFCVKSSVLIHDVIAQLLTHSADHPDLADLSAQEILKQTLLRFHRC